MMTDNAVARTREALGMEVLKSVQDSLTAAQNGRIARVLEELDARHESWGNFLRRDVRYTVLAEFRSVVSLDSWRTRQHFKARYYQAELQRRQAMLAFAARAYEIESWQKTKERR